MNTKIGRPLEENTLCKRKVLGEIQNLPSYEKKSFLADGDRHKGRFRKLLLMVKDIYIHKIKLAPRLTSSLNDASYNCATFYITKLFYKITLFNVGNQIAVT